MSRKNPFLPKTARPIRWQAGSAQGSVGIPLLDETQLPPATEGPSNGYKKSTVGRKPKAVKLAEPFSPDPKRAAMIARQTEDAGIGGVEWKTFPTSPSIAWGSSFDMLAVVHGAVGCSALEPSKRLHLAGFTQGVESFTALDACTNLQAEDLEDNGNARLGRALDEAQALFPLARGIAILNEEPIALLGTDLHGIIKAKAKASGRPIISTHPLKVWIIAGFKAIATHAKCPEATPYDVALANCERAPALTWIVSKLLADIGLNPVHASNNSSTGDLARVGGCKLIVEVQKFLGAQHNELAATCRQLFGLPLIGASFANPDTCDASLRAIASHFDWTIQRRTETVIEHNREKVDDIIQRYRPRLGGKLVLNCLLQAEEAKALHLLGLRIGTREGWPGKTGVPRTPHVVFNEMGERSAASYCDEARPDLCFSYAGELAWPKRGVAHLPYSPLMEKHFEAFWGYDGFALLAAALDRHINAPWRKLVKPPWPQESG